MGCIEDENEGEDEREDEDEDEDERKDEDEREDEDEVDVDAEALDGAGRLVENDARLEKGVMKLMEEDRGAPRERRGGRKGGGGGARGSGRKWMLDSPIFVDVLNGSRRRGICCEVRRKES